MTQPPPFDDEDLICILSVAKRVAGAEAAQRIHERFAGTRIFVRSKMPADCELSQLIGWEAAKLIAAEIGGIKVDVPSFSSMQIRALESAIQWATLAGLTGRKVALLVNRTERHVIYIKAGLRRLGRLPELREQHV